MVSSNLVIQFYESSNQRGIFACAVGQNSRASENWLKPFNTINSMHSYLALCQDKHFLSQGTEHNLQNEQLLAILESVKTFSNMTVFTCAYLNARKYKKKHISFHFVVQNILKELNHANHIHIKYHQTSLRLRNNTCCVSLLLAFFSF